MYWSIDNIICAGSSDANLWADESTSNTPPSYHCVSKLRGLLVSENSTRALLVQKYTPVLLTMVIDLLASVIAIRQLLLISGDVEENPGPLGQGEVIASLPCPNCRHEVNIFTLPPHPFLNVSKLFSDLPMIIARRRPNTVELVERITNLLFKCFRKKN